MLVDLIEYPDIALVIKAPTGVRYTSQTAGFACEHPIAEGFLVPFETKVGRSELASLRGMFRGAWNPMTSDQADQLDGILRSHSLGVVVDRSKLDESTEAWVHVIVQPDQTDKIPLSDLASGTVSAILIWPNSD